MEASACQGCGTIIVFKSHQCCLSGSRRLQAAPTTTLRLAGSVRRRTQAPPHGRFPPRSDPASAELPQPGLHPPAGGLTPVLQTEPHPKAPDLAFVFGNPPASGRAPRAHLRCHQTAPNAPSPSTSPAPSSRIRSWGYTDPGGAGKGVVSGSRAHSQLSLSGIPTKAPLPVGRCPLEVPLRAGASTYPGWARTPCSRPRPPARGAPCGSRPRGGPCR